MNQPGNVMVFSVIRASIAIRDYVILVARYQMPNFYSKVGQKTQDQPHYYAMICQDNDVVSSNDAGWAGDLKAIGKQG